MRAFWRILITEWRLSRRETTSFLFIVLFPAALLYLMGMQLKTAAAQSANAITMLSLSPMLFGLMAFPTALVSYRERGMLRRLRMTPLSPAIYLVAQALAGLTLVLIGGALVIAVGTLVFKAPLPAHPLLLTLAFGVGTLAFIALGALLGSFIASTRTIQTVSVIVFGAMTVAMVFNSQPGASFGAQIARLLPAHHLSTLVQALWLGGSLAWGSLAVLAGLAVVSLAAAIKLFRWE